MTTRLLTSKSAGRHSVVILLYHSINTRAADGIHAPIIVDPTWFEEHMAHLAARAHVISLDHYVDAVRGRARIPRDSTIITFDDGYKDNFIHAYPVLKRYNLPATFFLSTGYIGTGLAKWEDRLSLVIARTRAPTLTAEVDGLGYRRQYSLSHPGQKLRAIDELISVLGRVAAPNRQEVLARIEGALGVNPDDLLPHDLMLSWDDVREMTRTPGITFGSHGVTHARLSQLSDHDVRQELAGSKSRIEAEIQRPVRFFSYPYGELGDRHDLSTSYLKSAGFESALTLIYGQNDERSDLFYLKRVGVPNQGRDRFPLSIWLRSSALGEPLKQAYNLFFRRLP